MKIKVYDKQERTYNEYDCDRARIEYPFLVINNSYTVKINEIFTISVRLGNDIKLWYRESDLNDEGDKFIRYHYENQNERGIEVYHYIDDLVFGHSDEILITTNI